MKQRWLLLVASVALALAAGGIGSLATGSSVSTWYQGLAKPDFNPPDAVFAPVWTTLYVMMAVAAWRAWVADADRDGRRLALGVYAVQLALNLLWSVIFFGLRQPGWALLEIAALCAAVVATGVLFWRLDRIAGLLIVPYAAWVAFAALLNFEIWRLN